MAKKPKPGKRHETTKAQTAAIQKRLFTGGFATQAAQFAQQFEENKKLSRDALEKLDLAVRRMAGPPTTRLKWVLDFSRKDLALLQPGEKEALGYDLRGLVHHSLGRQPGYRFRLASLSDRELGRYQEKIAAGFRMLLSDPPRGGTWPFPAEPFVAVVDEQPKGSRRSNRRRFVVHFGGDETASILGGVANLIVEAGEHLRTCLECKTPFVASMKQARYCSASCSQRARNKRRPKEDRWLR